MRPAAARAWPFPPGARARAAARLCGHGAGLAVVGDRSAQSVSRGRIFLAFLREALAGAVRRPSDLRSGHAAQLRADAVRAQAAGDLLASSGSAARPVPLLAAFAARRRRRPARRLSAGRARRACCRSPSRSRCGRRCTTASGISCSCCRRSRCSAASPARFSSGRHAQSRRLAAVAAAARLHRRRRHCRSSRWCGCTPTNTPTSTGLPAALRGARDRYMLDYWGLSFKQASQALLREACRARRDEARRPPLEDRGLRAAPLAAGRARPRFRNAPGIRRAPTSR